MSDATSNLKSTLTTLLAENDWIAYDPPCFHLAYKEYKTAVGIKIAQVYLTPESDDNCIATLRAEYMSEGRNILSTIWHPLPVEPSEEALIWFLERFNADIDQRVSETYAMRLSRPTEQLETA